MAYVNWVTYEAQLKIVYYGPAYAGKTTSLKYLSLRLETDVKELPTADDRSVFFEYAQSQKLTANQLEVKFLYWTLPGQQKYRRTRHLVLAATDAVVFGSRVRVKDLDSHAIKALLVSRALLVKIKRDLENQIRGLLKNLGLVIGRAKMNVFAVRAAELTEDRPELAGAVEPLLKAR